MKQSAALNAAQMSGAYSCSASELQDVHGVDGQEGGGVGVGVHHLVAEHVDRRLRTPGRPPLENKLLFMGVLLLLQNWTQGCVC